MSILPTTDPGSPPPYSPPPSRAFPIFDEDAFPGLTFRGVPLDRWGYVAREHSIWLVNLSSLRVIGLTPERPPIPFSEFFRLESNENEELAAFLSRVTIKVKLLDTPVSHLPSSRDNWVLVTLSSTQQVPTTESSGFLIPRMGVPSTLLPEVAEHNLDKTRERRPLTVESSKTPRLSAEPSIEERETRQANRIQERTASITAMLSRAGDVLPLSEQLSRIPDSAVRVGKDMAGLVVDGNGVRTHNPHPSDPGFSFGPYRSILRHGEAAVTSGDYRHFMYGLGTEVLNPLCDKLASSTTDPIRAIVPCMAVDYLQGMIGRALKAVVQLGIDYADDKIKEQVGLAGINL